MSQPVRNQSSPQPQRSAASCDSLESRYRGIGIAAVAAAKAVKSGVASRRDDNTAARLLASAAE